MKKLLSCVLTLSVLSLVLLACGESEPTVPIKEATNVASDSSAAGTTTAYVDDGDIGGGEGESDAEVNGSEADGQSELNESNQDQSENYVEGVNSNEFGN